MDGRYLAFPETEYITDVSATRLQLGYLKITTEELASSTSMIGLQYYLPLNKAERSGLIFSGFLDNISFGGGTGIMPIDPSFTNNITFATPTDVQLIDVSGKGIHAGITLAYTKREGNRAWQAGLAYEYYDIRDFEIAFRTLELTSNFTGTLDFSASYNSWTPYYTHRWFHPDLSHKWLYSTRFIASWAQPRRGLEGRISGPGFDYTGNSADAGNGRHMPDPYIGVGFTLESRENGWRLDIGSTLFIFALEPRMHKGIDRPLLFTFNMPL